MDGQTVILDLQTAYIASIKHHPTTSWISKSSYISSVTFPHPFAPSSMELTCHYV